MPHFSRDPGSVFCNMPCGSGKGNHVFFFVAKSETCGEGRRNLILFVLTTSAVDQAVKHSTYATYLTVGLRYIKHRFWRHPLTDISSILDIEFPIFWGYYRRTK